MCGLGFIQNNKTFRVGDSSAESSPPHPPDFDANISADHSWFGGLSARDRPTASAVRDGRLFGKEGFAGLVIEPLRR